LKIDKSKIQFQFLAVKLAKKVQPMEFTAITQKGFEPGFNNIGGAGIAQSV
jgi:saccharopine dehydrogenase-like NADP-dependent oxidoreductase